MVRIKSSIFTCLTGKVDGIVFFSRWGRIYARRAVSGGSRPRTPLQQLQCNRMSDVMTFYGIVRTTFLGACWREAAKGKSCSGMNLFVRRNIGGFDGCGEVADYTRLHFTAGVLPVCDCLEAEYDAESRRVRLGWQNRTPLNGERLDDRLVVVVVVVSGEGEFTLFSPSQLQCRRRECAALIDLPVSGSLPRWVYVAFVDEGGTVFSDNVVCPL